MWTIVGIRKPINWPDEDTTVIFRGHAIVLRPERNEFAPSVMLEHEDNADVEALHTLRRFLSALAWVKNMPIEETTYVGAGFPIAICNDRKWSGQKDKVVESGNQEWKFPTQKFTIEFLPEPEERKCLLALALYREGITINNLPFRFLSLYKILNLICKKGNEQINWINDNLNQIKDETATSRILRLKNLGEDVGRYIFVSCRCAIAHTSTEPVVDPEDPCDILRLHEDFPLILALAKLLMEKELGIKSLKTYTEEKVKALRM